MGIVFAGLSAVMFGAADFAGGLATRRSPVYAVLVVSQSLGIAIAAVAAPLVGATAVTVSDVLWGMAAGLAGAFGLALLYRGLAVGVIAVVSPVAAVVGAAVPVFVGIALGESPSLTGWLGIGVSIPAILLLGWERVGGAPMDRLRRSLLYGGLAGLGFGAFFVLISRPDEAAGLWPLVGARGASILFVASAARIAGRSLSVERESLLAVAVAGVFDMAANIAFVVASRLYLLSVVSVVSSLYPAPTVILGRIVVKERLGAARLAGLASAITGVALMSL